MNMHKNARLTVLGREALVERVRRGEAVGEVARSLSVSRQTVYKWVRRWQAEGRAGLRDRTSRPRRSPRRLPERVVRRIVALRHQQWTGPRIAWQLGVPLSTVNCTLRRAQLGRRRTPRPPARRYERARPGELLHLDTKRLGRFTRVGHRIHRDRRQSSPGAGWEHLHVCIDDHSRVAYSEVLPRATGEMSAAFLRRAVRWFTAHGVRVEAVMTDNAGAYKSRAVRAVVERAQIRHVRTRPYTPRTNGKAERFIQTSLREWAYARSYPTSSHRAAALGRFLEVYNTERPHTALGFLPPIARLASV